MIAVDVLMETNNEFLQQKMPSSRSLQNIKFFGMRRSERFFGRQVAPKVFWLIRNQVSENKCAYFQLSM